MLPVMIQLTGWADSLGGQKVKFAIALAIKNAGFGPGWEIDVKTIGSDVREEFSLSVCAKTAIMASYDAGKMPRHTYELLRFDFKVPCYTMAEVYINAKSELDKLYAEYHSSTK